MSKAPYLSKSLKGISSVVSSIQQPIQDSIITLISNGQQALGNVSITGGSIDSVVIGAQTPGPIFSTTLQTGYANGTGYYVYFYAITAGDYLQWNPQLSQLNIQGNLLVRDMSDFGNIRIFGNTISSTNNNGNINLSPNRTGLLNVYSGINQTTTNGSIAFNTSSGNFTASSNSNVMLSSTSGSLALNSGLNTNINTNNGSINLNTGQFLIQYKIATVYTGTTSVQVQTVLPNTFVSGDSVIFTGTNSVPPLVGSYTISSVINSSLFQIKIAAPITVKGNLAGNVRLQNNINLNAVDYVNIPYNVPIIFGSTCQSIFATNENVLTIKSCSDINLSPPTGSNVNLPQNVKLTFSDIGKSIYSNGTDIVVSNSTGSLILNSNTIIDGDFTVNGTQTIINTEQMYIQDPIVICGGIKPPIKNDYMDRGIEFRYNDGIVSKTGFFGFKNSTSEFVYIPDGINTGNIFTGAIGNALFKNLTVDSITVGSYSTTFKNIAGDPDLTLNERNLYLNAAGFIQIPNNINLDFGTFGSKMYEDTSNDLRIVSNKDLYLIPAMGASVVLPDNGNLKFGSSSKIYSDGINLNVNTPAAAFSNDVSISGSLTVSGQSVYGAKSFERISVTTGSVNFVIDFTKAITYVNVVQGTGNFATAFAKPMPDGFIKYIIVSASAISCNLVIQFTSNESASLLDPGSGIVSNKNLCLSAGESTTLIYDSSSKTFLFVAVGGIFI